MYIDREIMQRDPFTNGLNKIEPYNPLPYLLFWFMFCSRIMVMNFTLLGQLT